MKTAETIAMAILGIVLVIAVLQRSDATTRILGGISSLTTSTVNSLVGAPR